MKNNTQFEEARNYAFLLLKYRPRSEQEIHQRLKRKKFEETVIDQTLSFLKDKGFIDDNLFAKVWIESRIKKPLGLYRLKRELKVKGVSEEAIKESISDIEPGYDEDTIVEKLTREKYAQAKGIAPQAAKRRIFSYLVRRGFSTESIINALRKL